MSLDKKDYIIDDTMYAPGGIIDRLSGMTKEELDEFHSGLVRTRISKENATSGASADGTAV